MKAVKKTGLVPVKHRGMIIGVPPNNAIKGVETGQMDLVDIPEGIETIDVAGYEPITEAKVEMVVFTDGLIDIPEDWRTVHGQKRAMIAKAILGIGPKDKLPVAEGQDVGDFAISVIETELARRATLSVSSDGKEPTATEVVTAATENQTAANADSATPTTPEVSG